MGKGGMYDEISHEMKRVMVKSLMLNRIYRYYEVSGEINSLYLLHTILLFTFMFLFSFNYKTKTKAKTKTNKLIL